MQFETKPGETEVTIALYGKGSEMWPDGIALYETINGANYYSPNRNSYLRYSYFYDGLTTCDLSKSLTKNVRMDDSGSTFWQTGDGWRNGFLKMVSNKNEYGTSLKYTPTDAVGNYYVKWVDIEPNVEYVFSGSVKILKGGKGKIALIEDNWANPIENFFLEFDQEAFGDEWFQFSIKFTNAAYTKVGIGICDLGGEALIDNLRLFKVSDAKAVTDPYKDPNGGNATVPAVTVRPTGGNIPTDAPTTNPTDTQPTDTQPTDVVTDPSEDTTDPTLPSDGNDGDDTDLSTNSKDGKKSPLRIVLAVGIAVGALVALAVIVVIILLLVRKKKTPPTA